MHLQGNLQAVFDALYDMGIIDPVLKMDWTEKMENQGAARNTIERALSVANACGNDVKKLMGELKHLDESSLHYLAMEVAREYAEYHARTNLQ